MDGHGHLTPRLAVLACAAIVAGLTAAAVGTLRGGEAAAWALWVVAGGLGGASAALSVRVGRAWAHRR